MKMTVPVTQTPKGEKIGITAPVIQPGGHRRPKCCSWFLGRNEILIEVRE